MNNVSKTNHLAVVIAGSSAFVLSSLYYSPSCWGIPGELWTQLPRPDITPSIRRVLGEIVRILTIVYVLARLIAILEATGEARYSLRSGCGLPFQP